MRRAAKVDANQAEIVQAFRKLGCSVLDLSRLGRGCPDLLVADSRVGTFLVEVKTRRGRFTSEQHAFWRGWRGAIVIVRSVEDVLRLMYGG